MVKQRDCVLLKRFRQPSILISAAFFLCLLVSFGQSSPLRNLKVDTLLTINGEVPTPRELSLADIAKLPRRTVQVKEADGSTVTFEGPELAEVLKLAGVEFGENLKGPRLSTYLLARGADDFRCVFALAELDHSFTDRVIILADKRDGKPLEMTEGPLRIILPEEKRKSRWVKQLTTLSIMRGGTVEVKKPGKKRK